jgi:N-acetylmuramoyl-L-alanine amidase
MLMLKNAKPFFALSVVFLLICGCSHPPYYSTNKIYRKQAVSYAKIIQQMPLIQGADSFPLANNWVGTINFNMRKPNYVIIHHTAQNSCEQTLKTFTTVKSQVSAHYVICKDGTVHHMLNDYLRAWQAGSSKWGSITDINSVSIGIELDNNGFEPFAEAQINSLLKLLTVLKKNYTIPASNFIGHGDIAPTRKNDPNWRFPWQQLAKQGFGYWYSDTTNVQAPVNFNYLQALRIIGYDMKDTAASIIAFKRHWLQDTTKGLNASQLKILYQLEKKFE